MHPCVPARDWSVVRTGGAAGVERAADLPVLPGRLGW